MRYQYRIEGNDVLEELAAPCGAHFVTNIVQQCVPCAGCILWAGYATLVTQLGLEATARPPATGPYLSGSSAPMLPPPSAAGSVPVSVAPMAMITTASLPPQVTQQGVHMGTIHNGPPPSAIQVYTHEQPIVGHAISPISTGARAGGYGQVAMAEPMKQHEY
jgi:hypothetical protein